MVHRFDFIVEFEREGSSEDNHGSFTAKNETGVGAWIELINHFGFEFNTGRILSVRCVVDNSKRAELLSSLVGGALNANSD